MPSSPWAGCTTCTCRTVRRRCRVVRATTGLLSVARRERYYRSLGENELRLELARLRVALRRLDADVRNQRRERKFFHRVGFGRDMKDIQLLAMEEEREYLANKVCDLERRLQLTPRPRYQPAAWLLLPLVLAWLLCRPLLPKRTGSGSVPPEAVLARTVSTV